MRRSKAADEKNEKEKMEQLSLKKSIFLPMKAVTIPQLMHLFK